MSTRHKRAARLVELGEAAEKTARLQASAAERALAEAIDGAHKSEAQWVAAGQVESGEMVSAADLAESEAYLRTLRSRADAAEQRSRDAQVEERRCASEVVRAATERRKLELWRDRIADGDRAEEARRERLASDELAARTAARSRP